MSRASWRGALCWATFALGVTFAGTSRADGDQAFSTLLDEVGAGLGLAFEGIGLSGRREGSMTYPLEEATISVADIPDGASIRHAYLYWVVYGSNGDDEVALDGNELTGTLIGTSPHTCWTLNSNHDLVDDPNRVYRADVKSLVTGPGDYVISGFPSLELDSDTQGAQLVVLYDDPASSTPRRVTVRDGAMTGSFETANPTDDFALHDEGPYVEAFWHLAAGDGQVGAVDGVVRFAGRSIGRVDGGAIFRNSAGQYWDSITFDVSDRLDLSEPTVRWQVNNSEGDCIVYAVSVLNYTLEALPEPEPGGGGAGGQSASGEAGGPGGGSVAVEGGAPGGEPGEQGGDSAVSMGGAPGSEPGIGGASSSDGGEGDGKGTIDDADARDTGGCGCRVPLSSHSGPAALLSLLGVAALGWRRRRS